MKGDKFECSIHLRHGRNGSGGFVSLTFLYVLENEAEIAKNTGAQLQENILRLDVSVVNIWIAARKLVQCGKELCDDAELQ